MTGYNRTKAVLRQYQALGTLKELWKAKEKQIPKKPVFTYVYVCPGCKRMLFQGTFERSGKYCIECGQALDWTKK